MRSASQPASKRCAIYTRKSSEEGLEQEFNSLDAQRASCEAYVQSQAGEGWLAMSDRYDDGGFSGGSMERPGLKRLLADIALGRIDVVVVYKVDRLTRSLMDFAKIVERFDSQQVSFVSVTQAFNTTSSMGRLTLNVLLSFAQFEREVTGERIRDKIALSKARGIWMGGMVPLGYDLRERHLIVNDGEASTVRLIFEQYLELGSVNALWAHLRNADVRSKAWTTLAGRSLGGVPISRGALFHLLNNRLFIGEIEHKGQIHAGRHQPIIDRDVFDRVQAKLSANQVQASLRPRRAARALLTGRVFDANGEPMSPSFAYGSKGKPYRYYIVLDLQVGRRPGPDDNRVRRVNGEVLETFVCGQVGRILGRAPVGVDALALVRRVELGSDVTEIVFDVPPRFGGRSWELELQEIHDRVGAGDRLFEEGARTLRLSMRIRFQMRGGRTWIEGGFHAPAAGRLDRGLIDALRSAHRELRELQASPLTAIAETVVAKAPGDQHRRQVSRMAFLAPDIQRMILEGRQPRKLKLRTLLKTELPLVWEDQRRWLASLT